MTGPRLALRPPFPVAPNRFLCSVLVLVLLLFTAALAQPLDGRYYYLGSIGDEAVQVDLTIDGAVVTGSYFYERIGTPLTLQGSLDPGGVLFLEERDPEGALTGRIEGVLSVSATDAGNHVAGSWRTPDGSRELPLTLAKIASYIVITIEQERIETRTVTPYFPSAFAGAAAPALNRTLNDPVRRAQLAFFEAGQDALEYDELYFGWWLEEEHAIAFAAPDFVSILTTSYTYTGGAHGNTDLGSTNLQLDEDGVRILELRDLFLPGSNYLQRLNELVLTDLRAQEAAWVLEGSVTELGRNDLAVFSVTPAGLTFAFPPYAMGPYVQGSFFVTVPYALLHDAIDPAGPLARFVR